VERMFGVVTDITERKQAEEERARLAAIVESSGDAIISKDLSGIVSSWNRSAEQLFGYSAQEMIGQPITRVIPPERLHEETDFLARLRAGECIDHYETVRVDKQGRRIDVSVTLSPICDSAGAVVGISKSVRDVTERKNAEEELRRQAEMLRLSFDAIIVWRLDGGIESWNRGAELLYGYSEAEALGRVTHELLKTTRSVPWPAVEAELRERGNWEGELRHIARDGREVMVSARHQLIVGSDGIVRILETNRDITERKRTQEALQASEHRWATTLRSIGDAVISTDPDGKIDFMNDVAQKLTGWTLDDAMGRDLPDVFDIVQEVTRIRPESPVAKVIRLGKVVGLANHTALIHRNGTEIPIEDSAAPIRDNQGKMEGVVLVFHDCREQRRVEAALRSSERLATTGRLAATIAHEIHNPLDAVGNLLFLIREEARDDNMREYASMASSELARVTQMTQQMLGFQREAARPVPVKIGEILSNVVALYDRKIQTAGIRLEQRIDHDVRVVALPGELRQIFANLVGNAIEAVGPQRGTIALRAYFTHDRRRGLPGVCVVVADNGPGIPEQVRSKIFEPFFTTKGESGTGLGLWITADILRKYDGAVRLRTCTHPARSGTCFSVFLPFQIHSESTPRS
jgi:PAS domain S-box-containing protein